MNPGAVSSDRVLVKEPASGTTEAAGGEDSLTAVVRKQEAALKRLEEKHGAGGRGGRTAVFANPIQFVKI
jgi:hypothetical protein